MELLYHYDKEVKLLRTFVFKNKLKAEIKYLNGDKCVLNRSDLSEKPTEPPHKEVVKEKLVSNKKTQTKKETKKEVKEEIKPEKFIIATKVSNNRKTKLGAIDSDVFKKFVNNNKLDKEAIELVLSGKQKTHKGFTFSYK